jgi:hypothetical protein
MSPSAAHEKVRAEHLRRRAYLYIRQSTMQQVLENTESTQRQYALRQRAIALGWSQDQIVVLDSDLGLSGMSMADREGFKRLVTEVGMDRAGIVMGPYPRRSAQGATNLYAHCLSFESRAELVARTAAMTVRPFAVVK